MQDARSTLPNTMRWAPAPGSWSSCVSHLQCRAISYLAMGLDALCGSRAGSSLGILMYHRVSPRVPGLPAPSINVTPRDFRRQLEGLLRRGFVVWPLRRLIDCHTTGEAVPPNVTVLTFDDGFESVYTQAVPVLKDLNVPATIFINTAFLDTETPFPFDHWGLKYATQAPPETYRPMSRQHVLELLDEPLIEFGAHTHTHQDFRGRTADFQVDLQLCVARMQAEFGIEQPTFAFPYGTPHWGFVTPELLFAARSTGVCCALTTESTLISPATDPFGWGRLNVFPWDTGATLTARLHDWYCWAPRLQRRMNAYWKKHVQVFGDESFSAHDRNPGACDVLPISPPNPLVERHTKEARTGSKRTPPLISIIVPTYNRAHWLGDAIESLVAQTTRSAFRFELIVVDNASTDHTQQVVEAAAQRSTVPLRYVHQTKPGDAPTRNAGVRAARGEWLAFFDDDQFAAPTWLSELLDAANRTGARIVGGPVHLDLPEETLAKLGDICRKALREIEYYPSIAPYLECDLPGTGNALVAREVFDRIGLFDETMTGGGSDSDLFLRARRAGFELWYTPRAVIRHRIPPERLSPEYFRWDALSGGAGYAELIDYKQRGLSRVLMMAVVRTCHALAVNLPLMVWARCRGDHGEALGRRTLLWRAEGYVRQTLALLAPQWFAQREFFESMDFRKGRSLSAIQAPTAPQGKDGT